MGEREQQLRREQKARGRGEAQGVNNLPPMTAEEIAMADEFMGELASLTTQRPVVTEPEPESAKPAKPARKPRAPRGGAKK